MRATPTHIHSYNHTHTALYSFPRNRLWASGRATTAVGDALSGHASFPSSLSVKPHITSSHIAQATVLSLVDFFPDQESEKKYPNDFESSAPSISVIFGSRYHALRWSVHNYWRPHRAYSYFYFEIPRDFYLCLNKKKQKFSRKRFQAFLTLKKSIVILSSRTAAFVHRCITLSFTVYCPRLKASYNRF